MGCLGEMSEEEFFRKLRVVLADGAATNGVGKQAQDTGLPKLGNNVLWNLHQRRLAALGAGAGADLVGIWCAPHKVPPRLAVLSAC